MIGSIFSFLGGYGLFVYNPGLSPGTPLFTSQVSGHFIDKQSTKSFKQGNFKFVVVTALKWSEHFECLSFCHLLKKHLNPKAKSKWKQSDNGIEKRSLDCHINGSLE